MQAKREYWVDFVKAYACVLVVLGHFFQSMVLSGIIRNNFFTGWFDSTIYYFHVPLFFICSGFLYQKYSEVNNLKSWKNNFLKKLLSLGIPYFVFSGVTWLMKTVFSDSVNTKPDGIFTSLFLKPISPYWYLYALFVLFIIIPTFKKHIIARAIFVTAVILKFVSFFELNINIYFIRTVLENSVWFVLGMCLEYFNLKEKLFGKKQVVSSVVLGLTFIVTSVILCFVDFGNGFLDFLLGLMACVVTIIIVVYFEKSGFVVKVGSWCADYTLPVFLMHTIFAAALRALLFKLGINSSVIHIVSGILISFIGPVLATLIIKKIKWVEFFLYPTKYIKITSKRGVCDV